MFITFIFLRGDQEFNSSRMSVLSLYLMKEEESSSSSRKRERERALGRKQFLCFKKLFRSGFYKKTNKGIKSIKFTFNLKHTRVMEGGRG